MLAFLFATEWDVYVAAAVGWLVGYGTCRWAERKYQRAMLREIAHLRYMLYGPPE